MKKHLKIAFIILLLPVALCAETPNSPTSLRSAINDLAKTFGNDYPDAPHFLTELTKIEKELHTTNPEEKKKAVQKFASLQKKALIANPLINKQPILFVARDQYPPDHHNTATMFQTETINTFKYKGKGWLKAIDFKNNGKVTTLLDPGPNATPRDPEVSYDGKRILFSMRKNIDDNYHIYEMNIDGSNLKQLTKAKNIFDIDPAYLPDGNIVFTSSREPKFCMCNRHIMGNLFRMKPDGANIHQIAKSTLFEGHSFVMPDGRILYDRWEYVDRNFGDAQGLWTVNPDGTDHIIYWGNNTGSPGGVIDARIIPETELCLCIFTSCHDRPWGAMAIIDNRKGMDGKEPVVKTWPADAINKVDVNGDFDAFKKVHPKYEDPYPLSSKYFLVSRMTGRGERMGIFLVDTFGNEILIHSDLISCFDPMPITARKRPRTIPNMRNYKNETGTFYVQDVYIGLYMENVERGSIKYLRIVESPEKKNWTSPCWRGQGAQAPAMNWHNFENKKILGTVPVEEDGSAYFEVPSDKYVFFQILDKNRMMVHSMRSGTIIQSGEKQGCIGCHEDKSTSPAMKAKKTQALQRKPSKLNGWYGPPREFSYQKEVQPIFDKNCVQCHDFGKMAGKRLILASDRTLAFNASYTDLWKLKLISCIGGGPAKVQFAKSWGSYTSTLTKVIRNKHPRHEKLDLDKESRDRIITWMDINAPYYPLYETAYPNNPCGRAPITSQQLQRLRKLTRAAFTLGHNDGWRSQISFERPEKSPCLTKLDPASPEYKEALNIIKSGKEQLEKNPRGDMENFIPCEEDLIRLKRYDDRMKQELKNREAIRNKTKAYDTE